MRDCGTGDETVAEIIVAHVFGRRGSDVFPRRASRNTPLPRLQVTEDSVMAIYADAARGGVGMVDVTDPSAPKAAGFVDLGGEVRGRRPSDSSSTRVRENAPRPTHTTRMPQKTSS